ncbi:AsmA family protein [Desulfobacter latus]|uniref:AsmA family protein n=1 Tax=Desulfobacter latus TaxID=2292 RepID=A0A850SPS3_9BACT|nr:AsmA family protein [Desulfobacter latus]NWH03474.1 AsmA family protein [Desulfobacter latus]
MIRFLKWVIVTIGILAGLIIGTAVLVPMFVDVGKYLPNIEAMVTRHTGRSFSMGDDIKLSLFPWAGIRLSDLTLGNPDGFGEQPMITVKRFEARVKVLPLLSRHIQVEKFIVASPRIALVKNKAGLGNWENIGPLDIRNSDQGDQAQSTDPGQETSAKTQTQSTELPIASLIVDRFAVINGFLSYVDKGSGLSKKISDLNLDLSGISLDKAIDITLGAQMDGKPVSLTGNVGPVGKNPGATDIDFDLMVKALDHLALSLKGRLIKPMTEQAVDMGIDFAPFSPKKLFLSLNQPFPIETRDALALDTLSLTAVIKGSAEAVSVSDGVLVLDDSTMNFNARVQAFEKPDLKCVLSVDTIDVDRYLPLATQKDSGRAVSAPSGPTAKDTGKSSTKTTPIDYAPLRKMVLDAKVNIGSLKVAGLSMSNITAFLAGKNGVFTLDPFSMDLYQGKAGAKVGVDVRKNTPTTTLHLTTSDIQAGPVIRDSMGKNIIEGALASDIFLSMTGDTLDMIKKSLAGNGQLKFVDGAIVGVDIAGTIRNAKAGIGLGESTTEKSRTDFAELKIPYTAARGLVKIPEASLVSPLLRLVAGGQTHLVKETLDFRIEPKLVATLKGQGDTRERSGLLIPLVISGSWENPKVRPDLEAILKNRLPDADELKQLIHGDGSDSGKKTDIKDRARGLIKDLFN